MKKFLLLFAVVIAAFFAPLVSAQTTSPQEYIKQYKVTTTINIDGTIDVVENIQYQFPSERHGIFRNIPIIKTNSGGKRFRLSLTDIAVTDGEGKPYGVAVTTEGGMQVLKIGNPNVTMTGPHTFVISYRVAGALTYFPGHDELYWNAVGTDWEIPILSAQEMVNLPEAIAPGDIESTCFVGVNGATTKLCTVTVAKNNVTFQATRALAAGEGLTTVVGFPKGIVAVVEPAELVPFFTTREGKITLVILAIVAFFWYIVTPVLVVRRWFVAGRDPKPAMGEVAAWFSPPKTNAHRMLTPAETGGLIDEQVDTRDIYATIVDLARRGYFMIKETAKNSFDLIKQKDWAGDREVQPFEKELMDGIFKTGDTVTLKNIDLSITISSVKDAVYKAMVDEDYFPTNPQTLRGLYVLLAVFAAVTLNPILLIVAVTFGLHMPRKTLFGAEQAMVARSLKNFLTSQDKQLAFQAKNQMMFEKLLPYAVAFGVEVIWAKRFADVALKQPAWYVSSTGGRFNSVVFANSIGRGYTTSFAASVSSRSSSGFSSGFSGGGSSGGGGGGGGGGSW